MLRVYQRQPVLPGKLRIVDGRVRLVGDKTGKATRAYLLQWAKECKVDTDTPLTMMRTAFAEQLRTLALIGESYGA